MSQPLPDASPPRDTRALRRLRWLARLLPNEHHAQLAWAALIGVIGAAVALAFTGATQGFHWLLTGERLRDSVETFRHLAAWQRLAVPAAGGLAAALALWLAPRLGGRKPLDYMEAVALSDGNVPMRSSLLRSAAAMCSIASGAAIGREGPLVQLAAAFASFVGRIRGMSAARLRLLVACGAAAGIAAAYNAPIAGALFVAEIILGSIAMESLGPLLIASVSSALVMRLVTGDTPLYGFAGFSLGSLWELPAFGLLGFVCALAAHVFQDALRGGRWLFTKLPSSLWFRLTLGGLLFGVIAIRWPEVAGNGQSEITAFIGGGVATSDVAVLLVMKVVAVAIVFGSGAVGGVFTPMLFTGAATGLLIGTAVAAALPGLGAEPAGYAVVGMGALLAAATQAPVMSMLMVFEMSLQYHIMPPLMIAVVVAYVTARSLGAQPMYAEALRMGPRSVFDRPLGVVTVGDVMRARTATASPHATFREAAERFLRAPAGEIFVCDDSGQYAGTVVWRDIEAYVRDANLADVVTMQDVARHDVPVVRSDLGLPEALAVFSRSDHDALPVVSGEDNLLVGTLVRADVFLVISELTRRERLHGNAG